MPVAYDWNSNLNLNFKSVYLNFKFQICAPVELYYIQIWGCQWATVCCVYIVDLDLASGLQVLQIQNHKYLGQFFHM